jgi:hypothetical protein
VQWRAEWPARKAPVGYAADWAVAKAMFCCAEATHIAHHAARIGSWLRLCRMSPLTPFPRTRLAAPFFCCKIPGALLRLVQFGLLAHPGSACRKAYSPRSGWSRPCSTAVVRAERCRIPLIGIMLFWQRPTESAGQPPHAERGCGRYVQTLPSWRRSNGRIPATGGDGVFGDAQRGGRRLLGGCVFVAAGGVVGLVELLRRQAACQDAHTHKNSHFANTPFTPLFRAVDFYLLGVPFSTSQKHLEPNGLALTTLRMPSATVPAGEVVAGEAGLQYLL